MQLIEGLVKGDKMEGTYSILGIIRNPYSILVRGRLGIGERIVCGLDSPGLGYRPVASFSERTFSIP
jgi:hypothetical protein